MTKPIMLPIAKIVEENLNTKTFIFNHTLDAKPGQFVNVWLPGIDEKPISISFLGRESGRFGITVTKVGLFTEKLHEMKVGDLIGFRGPFGNGFDIRQHQRQHQGKTVVIGGGCGSAPLGFLADEVKRTTDNYTIIVGARHRDALLFTKRFEFSGHKFVTVTDDGSAGKTGFTTDILTDLLYKEKIAIIYACGPDRMLKAILEIAEEHNIEAQVCTERYMKCGVGVCGSCCCDDLGIRVCKDGPVFDRDTAKKIMELGKYKRDGSGKKIEL